jgi:hypothetical protein
VTPRLTPNREFTEFEELAAKLVKVPKTEIDAERAKANGKKPKLARKSVPRR